MFDDLPAFRMAPDNTVDEVTRYLSTGPEDITNEAVLKWWYERQHIYPNLSQMALDYHTIPCKSHAYILVSHCSHTVTHTQVAPLMWSMSLVKADSFCHMSAIASLQNRRVLSSALGIGAGAVFWRTQSSNLLLFCLMSLVVNPCFPEIGIASHNVLMCTDIWTSTVHSLSCLSWPSWALALTRCGVASSFQLVCRVTHVSYLSCVSHICRACEHDVCLAALACHLLFCCHNTCEYLVLRAALPSSISR
jgi:hAT family C-terminal dimerisation region